MKALFLLLTMTFLLGCVKSTETIEAASGGESTPSKQDSGNIKISWIFGADTKTVSKNDYLILVRWLGYGDEWNKASTPIIRDFMDKSVSAEAFLETSATQLRELTAVLYRMRTDFRVIKNDGAKKQLATYVQIHDEGYMMYRELHEAVKNEDISKQNNLAKSMGEWGQRKTAIFIPMIRRIQTLAPGEFDKSYRKLQAEIANELRGK
jgi:hypothetical protein